jgi:3-hydroxyisobutyrate dehydrogenase-like beta-hydroxyacid dehydrogenase
MQKSSNPARYITSSTISVELSRKLEAQHKSAGQRYLAAPVLGRPDAAQAGKLFVLAAGAHSEDTDAILSAIGQKVFSIPGEAWHANLIKIACNFMLMSAIETMSESFAMVRKGGIEPQIFFEIFSDTLFSAPVYKNYGAMIVKQKYTEEAGFKVPLATKDIRLALNAAQELNVSLPTAAVILERLLQAIGNGQQDLDLSGLGKIAADNAGTLKSSSIIILFVPAPIASQRFG